MDFKKYFTDALLGGPDSDERIKSFHNFLLDTKIADDVNELLIMSATLIDVLVLSEDEVKRLKEFHKALMPFGLNCRVTYIKKGENNYPLSATIVKAGKDPEPSSRALSIDEVVGATKMLHFIVAYKDVLMESDEPTEFNELLGTLRTEELMAMRASNQKSDLNYSQSSGETEPDADIKHRIAELNERAKKLLGGNVHGDGEEIRFKKGNSYYIYERSPKHLYGSQVFTKKNVFDPDHRIRYSRQWVFYPNELDILEAFIKHDEEILRNLKAQHDEA